MAHPTDDDQHPALPRHTTDAELGDVMTKQMALHRASKGGAELAARQEGWREAIEAAAQAVPQGWCQPETSHIEMDVVLGQGIQAAIYALAEKGPTDD